MFSPDMYEMMMLHEMMQHMAGGCDCCDSDSDRSAYSPPPMISNAKGFRATHILSSDDVKSFKSADMGTPSSNQLFTIGSPWQTENGILFVLIDNDCVKCLDAILKCRHVDGGMPNEKGMTPFAYAIMKDKIKCAKTIMKNSKTRPIPLGLPPAPHSNPQSIVPLCIAIAMNKIEFVRSLVAHVPFIDLDEVTGMCRDVRVRHKTPLMVAVLVDNVEIVEILLARADRLNLNATDAKGWTALHYAAHDGRTHLVARLLRAGIDRSLRAKAGKTAGELATTDEMREMIDNFDANVTVEIPHVHVEIGDGGNTVLHTAVINKENIEVIRALLVDGIDLDIKNDDGKVVLQLAKGEVKRMIYKFKKDQKAKREKKAEVKIVKEETPMAQPIKKSDVVPPEPKVSDEIKPVKVVEAKPVATKPVKTKLTKPVDESTVVPTMSMKKMEPSSKRKPSNVSDDSSDESDYHDALGVEPMTSYSWDLPKLPTSKPADTPSGETIMKPTGDVEHIEKPVEPKPVKTKSVEEIKLAEEIKHIEEIKLVKVKPVETKLIEKPVVKKTVSSPPKPTIMKSTENTMGVMPTVEKSPPVKKMGRGRKQSMRSTVIQLGEDL